MTFRIISKCIHKVTAIRPPQTLSHSWMRGGWGSQPKENLKLMSTKYQIIVLVQNKEIQFYKTIGTVRGKKLKRKQVIEEKYIF